MNIATRQMKPRSLCVSKILIGTQLSPVGFKFLRFR